MEKKRGCIKRKLNEWLFWRKFKNSTFKKEKTSKDSVEQGRLYQKKIQQEVVAEKIQEFNF